MVFPLIRVQGSNYEMGCQHGEKCAQLIKDHLAVSLRNLQQNGTPKEKALAYAKQSVNFAASYAPHLVEELNGIADGAKISREEIYYLNSPHPKTYEGCTTFVVFPERTQDNTVIATQNIDNDMSSRTIDRGIILHEVPDNGPEILAFCRAGNLYPHGINSVGMTRVGNALTSVLDRQFGVSTDWVGRLCLEQDTVEKAVNCIRRANRSKSNTVIMTDNSGRAALVEFCPDDLGILEPYGNVPNRGYFFHTNHFLHPDMLKYEGRHGDRVFNSATRLTRIRQLLHEWDETGEKMSIDDAKKMLSDHANTPDSVCAHLAPPKKTTSTVVCVIAQPAKKTIHVCKGNPCENQFQTYTI